MNTELHGPQAGNCAEQFLVVGGDIWPTGFDKICGVNPDQHFYVHLDREKQAEADQGRDDADVVREDSLYFIQSMDSVSAEQSDIGIKQSHQIASVFGDKMEDI